MNLILIAMAIADSSSFVLSNFTGIRQSSEPAYRTLACQNASILLTPTSLASRPVSNTSLKTSAIVTTTGTKTPLLQTPYLTTLNSSSSVAKTPLLQSSHGLPLTKTPLTNTTLSFPQETAVGNKTVSGYVSATSAVPAKSANLSIPTVSAVSKPSQILSSETQKNGAAATGVAISSTTNTWTNSTTWQKSSSSSTGNVSSSNSSSTHKTPSPHNSPHVGSSGEDSDFSNISSSGQWATSAGSTHIGSSKGHTPPSDTPSFSLSGNRTTVPSGYQGSSEGSGVPQSSNSATSTSIPVFCASMCIIAIWLLF